MQNKSDVEIFWDALRKHFGNQKEWSQLDGMQQMQFVQAINMILQVANQR